MLLYITYQVAIGLRQQPPQVLTSELSGAILD